MCATKTKAAIHVNIEAPEAKCLTLFMLRCYLSYKIGFIVLSHDVSESIGKSNQLNIIGVNVMNCISGENTFENVIPRQISI